MAARHYQRIQFHERSLSAAWLQGKMPGVTLSRLRVEIDRKAAGSGLSGVRTYATLRLFSDTRAWRAAKSSIIAALKAGISDGCLLLTQFLSRTTSSSCHLPPALRTSS